MGVLSLLSVNAWVCAGCATEANDFPRNTGGDAGALAEAGAGSPTSRVPPGGVAGRSNVAFAGAGGSNGASSGAGSGGSNLAGLGGAAGANDWGHGGSGGATGSTAGASGSAGGGSGGAGGSTQKPSVCDGAATRVLASDATKIDDFEGATISASWSSFNDVMPVPNAFSIVQVVGGGATTTSKFGHYFGNGAKTLPNGGYGVGTVYNIGIDKVQGKYCIDISAFDGVSFWARAAKNGANVEVNFVVPETNATKDGGDCASGCYNHPRIPITLTTDWKRYAVTFANAGGGAYGVTNRIQELAWLAPLDNDWDFSLDEIAFYKGAPPTGPVGP